MSEAQKKADKKFYEKMKSLGWIKRPFWIHKNDITDITAYVDAKANRRKLINDLKSEKGEK